MLDLDTFATLVYVMIDDFVKSTTVRADAPPKRGQRPALCPSEALTLAVLGQCPRFTSEADFVRFAHNHLRPYFPALPHRTQIARHIQGYKPLLDAFFAHLAGRLSHPDDAYEALDCSAVPVRNLKRRGRGWLAGIAAKGWSTRFEWFFGFQILLASSPHGVITGFGFGPGNLKDQPLTDTFLAARALQHPGLATVGAQATVPYLTDKGFEGKAWYKRWRTQFDAMILCPPKVQNTLQWPVFLVDLTRRLRQIVETVFDRLHHSFGLDRERPHSLAGFSARLSAKATLHNLMILLNRQAGRDDLAFADLLDW